MENNRIGRPPQLPNSIYQVLPDLLKNPTEMFELPIEKDVLLISMLTVLSGVLPNVSGTYFNKPLSPHLYAFFVAPAGTGKGIIEWSKYLAQPIHDEILQQSLNAKEDYIKELNDYHSMSKSQRLGSYPPNEPAFKTHFLPANSSASAFLKSLQSNNNCGFLFETEADVLSNTLKQEWGAFNYLLRGAFHHETASMNRNQEYLELKNLRLGVLLSGTPDQVVRLLPSVEDGLFSRFSYYYFEDDVKFRDPFISFRDNNFVDFFNQCGSKVYELYQFMLSQYKPFNFRYTKIQAQKFTETFNDMLQKNNLLIGNNIIASIKRLGVITFRISMILSVLRMHEKKVYDNPINCTETDFEISLALATALESHAIYIFRTIPSNQLSGQRLQLYESLPENFNRQDYLKIAKELDIKDKAAEKYIKIMVDSKLLLHNHNDYKKINL
jgi:hypothetical protein